MKENKGKKRCSAVKSRASEKTNCSQCVVTDENRNSKSP